jgi:two-component system, OmpR family, sensor histidine kinase SenX3
MSKISKYNKLKMKNDMNDGSSPIKTSVQSKTKQRLFWVAIALGSLCYLAFIIFEYKQSAALLQSNQSLVSARFKAHVQRAVEQHLIETPQSKELLLKNWHRAMLPIVWIEQGSQIYPFTQDSNPNALELASCDEFMSAKNQSASVNQRGLLVAEIKKQLSLNSETALQSAFQNYLIHIKHERLSPQSDILSRLCILEDRGEHRLSKALVNKIVFEGFEYDGYFVKPLALLVLTNMRLLSDSQSDWLFSQIETIAESYNLSEDVFTKYRNQLAAQTSQYPSNIKLGTYGVYQQHIIWQKSEREVIIFKNLFETLVKQTKQQLAEIKLIESNTRIEVRLPNTSNNLVEFKAVEIVLEQTKWLDKQRLDSVYFALKACFLLLLVSLFFLYLRSRNREHEETARYLVLKEEFVNSVSHELKTPIASLKVMSEMLLARVDRGLDIKDYPDRINLEVNQLQEMVEQILLLNRIRAGVEYFKTQACCLKSIIEKELTGIKELAANLPICIDLNLEPRLQVDGNQVLLALLFRNLLENAVKYCDKTSAYIVIREHTPDKQEPKSLIVELEDNAKGIQQKNIEKVFHSFFRESTSVSGTGIGLNLCAAIMDIHRGSIQIVNSSESGTIWRLTFLLKD